MGKFILHVGQMKSGTTYIQNILFNNRDELKKQGWIYPGARLNHQHASYGLCGKDIPWVQDPSLFKKFADNLINTIKKTDDNVIVSAECLASLNEAGIKSFLEKVGTPDKVIVTVRGLLKTLPSAWQQSVKGGGTRSANGFYEDLVKNRDSNTGLWRTYRYGKTIELWSKFAPVDVVIMPEGTTKKTDLWDLFQSISGLPLLKRLDVEESQVNSSVTYETAELLRAFNQLIKSNGLNKRFNDIYLRDFVFRFKGSAGTPISYLKNFEENVISWNKEEHELLEKYSSGIVGNVDNLYKYREPMNEKVLEVNTLTKQAIQHIFQFVVKKYNLELYK